MASRPRRSTVDGMDSGNGPRPTTATPGSTHARDLGYLDKFLDKLKSQAAAMPRGDARTRLEKLLNEETDRWREIAALLEASPSRLNEAPHEAPLRRGASSGSGPGEPAAAASRNPVATRAAMGEREWRPRVTIGSLKRPPG